MNNELIIQLINERSELHPDDLRIREYWAKITEYLSKNVLETINFLSNCSEKELFWLREVFEDISSNLQSKDFIDCLKKLQAKYPNLDMETDIKYAIEALE